MRILTEAEYQRRLDKARAEGWQDRCKENEDREFRESLWTALRETRQDLDRQIMALREALNKAGIEDPTEPKKACGCVPVERF